MKSVHCLTQTSLLVPVCLVKTWACIARRQVLQRCCLRSWPIACTRSVRKSIWPGPQISRIGKHVYTCGIYHQGFLASCQSRQSLLRLTNRNLSQFGLPAITGCLVRPLRGHLLLRALFVKASANVFRSGIYQGNYWTIIGSLQDSVASCCGRVHVHVGAENHTDNRHAAGSFDQACQPGIPLCHSTCLSWFWWWCAGRMGGFMNILLL